MQDIDTFLKKKEEEKEKTPLELFLERKERERRYAEYTVTAPSPLKLPEELKPKGIPEKLKQFIRPPKPARRVEMRALKPEEREREIEAFLEEKAIPRYWEKRYAEVGKLPSIVPKKDRRDLAERIIDVPGQFLTHSANMFLFGIPGFVHQKVLREPLPTPKTEFGEIAGGLGQLVGMIGPGMAVAPFKVTARLAKKMLGPPAKTLVGRFIQNVMQSTTTLGLANAMVTWEGKDVEEIFANKLDAMASGAATGAVFGATPWLRLSSNHPILSSILRIGIGSAVIDTIHGQHPFDERTVMQKVYDYGLNIYFLRHGAPEMKAKALAKKLAVEAKAFNKQAEIDGFEVRLPDTVEKIMAELKKEGFELEFIKPKEFPRLEKKEPRRMTKEEFEQQIPVEVVSDTHSILLAEKGSAVYLRKEKKILAKKRAIDTPVIDHERGHALYDKIQPPVWENAFLENRKAWREFLDTSTAKSHWVRYAKAHNLGKNIPRSYDWVEVAADLHMERRSGKLTNKSELIRILDKFHPYKEIVSRPILERPEGSAPIYQPKDTTDPIGRQVEENILKLSPKEREDVRKVQGVYEEARKELAEREKKSFGKVINWLSTQFIDLTGRTQRRLMKQAGELGREASIRADLARSSPTIADYEVGEWSKRIYEGLTLEQERILNEDISSRGAVLSVQKKVAHPGGLKKDAHQEFVGTIPKAIHQKADVFFDSMRRPLVLLKQEGFLSQESFDRLSKRQDYSPRWFIDAVDPPALDSVRRRSKISVQDSGIRTLKTGDISAMEQNSRLFLQQIYDRTWARIMKNRANKALLEIARELPDNGVVKEAGKGRPPVGTETIIAWEDGKPQRMWTSEEVAKSWALSDPQTTQALAHVVGWLTGTKILKAFATGYNPAFAITNMPRDLALIWMTTPEYSSLLPKAGMQMGVDLIATARDAWKRKGAYLDFIKEGGGIQFLTKQGQISRATGKLKQWQGVLGYIGETSEIWSRLAVRRRSLINGKKPYEATWTARNYLDFSKGGPITKAVDHGIPYLNASIQATRGIFRAFRDRPAQSVWKVAQIGTLAMGMYYANRYLDPEGWESLSDKTKARYWCFFTPFRYKDKNGNDRRLYLKIAKDQGQRVFTAIFEAMAAKSVGDKIDGDYVSGVIRDAMPLMPETALPPALEGLLGYASNKDFWYNDDIWRGAEVEAKEEWKYRTSLLARQFGKINLSPVRAERALQQVFTTSNFYTDALGFGVRALLGELPEMQKQQTINQIVLDLPIINRIFSSTSPHEFKFSQLEDERINQNTARWVLTREFDNLLEQHLRAKDKADGADMASLQQVQDFLKGKPIQEIQRLLTRWTNTEKLWGTKYKSVWKNMLGMTPESRAKIFFDWWHGATAKQRNSIVKDLEGLTKTGFFSDRFWIEYGRLMGEKK